MSELAKKIMSAVETSFLDYRVDSVEELRPRLLYNNVNQGKTVLAELTAELGKCDHFWFSVAFITDSGLVMLKNILKELEERGITGKILTTDYLEFNTPKALTSLLQFSNLEVKVFTKEHFHTKGYMFYERKKVTFVAGSSNLTQRALKETKEWNLKVTSLEQGELIRETEQEFQTMWQQGDMLTSGWINEYEKRYVKVKKARESEKIARIQTHRLEPNRMQMEATRALEALREKGERKGLLISATGTGKTYLSAFDVRNVKPSRTLFLAHRERILTQSVESYKDVLGEGIDAGILSGNNHDWDAQYLFSTVQMMSKPEVLQMFEPDAFEYLCIDETHRSGGESYQRIMDYFKPKFLLGMTATPERTDGFDIYSQFDHNIAFEIRLQEAMKENMLCPFHYFGVSEVEVDGKVLDDQAEFAQLVRSERVRHLIEKVKFYGYSGDRVKGLIFCSRKEEAKGIAEQMNQKGFRTVALDGGSSTTEREEAIRRLEQDENEGALDYILTVDIFNEGVNIPSINQVVMLRPTQSAIIFVQQLGRGLRKTWDKEYVVVIDFIGNYAKNFLIPIALSGDRTFNKDTVRKYVTAGNRVIPGCSTVNFDPVAKEKIFASINQTNFSTLKFLRDEYQNLKYKMGRVPSLLDFYENGAVDPAIILSHSKNYYAFLKRVDPEYSVSLTPKQELMLEFVSTILANGKRPHELLMIRQLMEYDQIDSQKIQDDLAAYGIENDDKSIEKAVEILKGGFIAGNDRTKYQGCTMVEVSNVEEAGTAMAKRCESYRKLVGNLVFKNLLEDVVAYGLRVYRDRYANRYQDTNFVLYEKYSRKDVCRLLNWDSDESSVIYGYKVKYGTCPIFVTYHKSEEISDSTKYADQFVDRSLFSWMSRSRLTLESKEVKDILAYQESGLEVHLFVKKEDGEGRDFYYLGKADPILSGVNQMEMEDGKGKRLSVVNIPMHMREQVQEDVYGYLVE